MLLLTGLFLLYSGHILYSLLVGYLKRRYLKVGDTCSFFIGEERLRGFVVRVHQEIDVWVSDTVFRLNRDQIYV